MKNIIGIILMAWPPITGAGFMISRGDWVDVLIFRGLLSMIIGVFLLTNEF